MSTHSRLAADQFSRIGAELGHKGDIQAAHIAFQAAAAIDLLDEELQTSFGAFNGQKKRQELFHELVRLVAPKAIVETGTYRGTTTEYIAQSFSGPIYTCELDLRYFYQAWKKLSRFANVKIAHSDSRAFLDALLADLEDFPALFYLDAHWASDLPLAEELGLIFKDDRPKLVMIDDFRDPFDEGYGYDDYGPGKALDLHMIEFLRNRPVDVFFPTALSSEDTGHKRGCVVLASAGLLSPTPLLRRFTWPE